VRTLPGKKSRKRQRKKIRLEVDEKTLEDVDLFMSVGDFADRRVILPDFLTDENWSQEESEDDEGDGSEDDYDTGDDDDEGEYYFEGGEVEQKHAQDEFCDRECYEFNARLESSLNDGCCVHCSKYLTLRCPSLDDFMDDIEDYGDD
jgi:hypothetical protein